MPTGALDAAVAGAGGGAVSSLGGGGTAVAGAAGAIGTAQLAPILEQLTAAISRLSAALLPVAGGGPSIAGVGATEPGCGCGGGSPVQSPTQRPDQGPRRSPPKEAGYEHGHNHPGEPHKHDRKSTQDGAKSGKVEQADQAQVKRWLTGDTKGLDADLVARLVKVAEGMGEKLEIVSGNRTRQEQEVLYQKYLNGTGNLAAKPGTSNHEHGDAADVNIGGASLANNAKAKQLALKAGLHFPVQGEPWHVEVK